MNDTTYIAVFDTGIDNKLLNSEPNLFPLMNLTQYSSPGTKLMAPKFGYPNTHGTHTYAVICQSFKQDRNIYINTNYFKKRQSYIIDAQNHSFHDFTKYKRDKKCLGDIQVRPIYKMVRSSLTTSYPERAIKVFDALKESQFINCSFSIHGDYVSQVKPEVIEVLDDIAKHGKNKILTSSSGNTYEDCQFSPLNSHHATTLVGAFDLPASSIGAKVLVSAYGGRDNIITSNLKQAIRYNGTSAASPDVCSVAIKIETVNPKLSKEDIERILAYSTSWSQLKAKDINAYSNSFNKNYVVNNVGLLHSAKYGYGKVDETASLLLAKSYRPEKSTLSAKTFTIKLTAKNNRSYYLGKLQLNDACRTSFMSITINDKINYTSLKIQMTANKSIYTLLDNSIYGSKFKDAQGYSTSTVQTLDQKIEGEIEFRVKNTADYIKKNELNAKVLIRGYENTLIEDHIFTNEYSNLLMAHYDGKKNITTHNRENLWIKKPGNHRINCSAITPNSYGDGRVVINLNKGSDSLINGRHFIIPHYSLDVDQAYGGAGPDTLIGNQNDNHLWGGPGDDFLKDDHKNDTDRYYFSSFPFANFSNHDIIEDQGQTEIFFEDYEPQNCHYFLHHNANKTQLMIIPFDEHGKLSRSNSLFIQKDLPKKEFLQTVTLLSNKGKAYDLERAIILSEKIRHLNTVFSKNIPGFKYHMPLIYQKYYLQIQHKKWSKNLVGTVPGYTVLPALRANIQLSTNEHMALTQIKRGIDLQHLLLALYHKKAIPRDITHFEILSGQKNIRYVRHTLQSQDLGRHYRYDMSIAPQAFFNWDREEAKIGAQQVRFMFYTSKQKRFELKVNASTTKISDPQGHHFFEKMGNLGWLGACTKMKKMQGSYKVKIKLAPYIYNKDTNLAFSVKSILVQANLYKLIQNKKIKRVSIYNLHQSNKLEVCERKINQNTKKLDTEVVAELLPPNSKTSHHKTTHFWSSAKYPDLNKRLHLFAIKLLSQLPGEGEQKKPHDFNLSIVDENNKHTTLLVTTSFFSKNYQLGSLVATK